MRMLILGGGLMGRAAAYDMARQDDVQQVTLVDVDPRRLEEAVETARSDKVEPVQLNVEDRERALDLMRGSDAVLGAVSYTVNLELSRLAMKAGVHFCDMGGNNAVVEAQLGLDAEAKAKGVSIIPDTGLAPGMVGLLTIHGVGRMDTAERVRMRVGGLPAHPQPPLDYALVFSVEGLVNEYVERCVAIRHGRIVENVVPLDDLEELSFPPRFEQLEAFNTSGGTSTLPRTLLGKVRELDYKTIRYPGHAAKVKCLFELGLMSSEPIDAGGARVAPRDVLERCLAASLPRTDDDVVLMRVTVDGRKDGARARATYEMVDAADRDSGLTAMMRGTAFPSSIICLMMARGETPPGALPQELAVDSDRFIDEVRARGLPLRVRFEAG